MGDRSTHADRGLTPADKAAMRGDADPEAWRTRTRSRDEHRDPVARANAQGMDAMRAPSGRLEILPDEAVTNVSTYPAAYRICNAHDGGHFVTVECAGPLRLFGQIVFAGNLDDCLAYLGRKLGRGPATEETTR